MASTLMSVCLSIQDEYGERFSRVSRRIETIKGPGADRYRAELAALRSLYAALIAVTIQHMPEHDREIVTARLGEYIDSKFNILEPA